MRSTVGPHKFDFAICKDCFWTVTVLNSDLYQESVCPICSGVIDKIPMVEPNEAKILDYISAYVNMKYLYGITDHDRINEESWIIFEQFLPHVY
jgi:hypothetical protein